MEHSVPAYRIDTRFTSGARCEGRAAARNGHGLAQVKDTLPMKVAQYAAYGAARDVLKITDAPLPTPAAGELLVRVRASSVNPIDCALRRGYGRAFFESRPFATLPIRPGRDAAGEVAAVGEGCTRFRPGDLVYACVLYQANAEYLVVPESLAAHKPATLSFKQAAAMPFASVTAWTALVKVAGLNEANTVGKRVVIPRAAGGVGSFAVQLVKAWGGYVAALCSTRNVELVRSLGADEVIDYKSEDVRERLRDYDVALDTAFHTESMLLDALKVGAGACYLTVVSPKLRLIDEHGLEDGLRRGEQLLAARIAEQRALGRGYHWVFAEPDGHALEQIGRLVDAGRIRPVIDSVFGLTQIVQAHERCESGAAQGKIVLDLEDVD